MVHRELSHAFAEVLERHVVESCEHAVGGYEGHVIHGQSIDVESAHRHCVAATRNGR